MKGILKDCTTKLERTDKSLVKAFFKTIRVPHFIFSSMLLASLLFVMGCEERKPVTSQNPKAQPSPPASSPPASSSPTVSNSVTESPKEKEPEPTPTGKKLDSQLTLALKQSRGEPPFDKPTSLQPDIPIRSGESVLVDLKATASEDLLNRIAAIGGKTASSPDPAHIVRAMIPLNQLEALAERADIETISPAVLTFESGVKVEPPLPAGAPVPPDGN